MTQYRIEAEINGTWVPVSSVEHDNMVSAVRDVNRLRDHQRRYCPQGAPRLRIAWEQDGRTLTTTGRGR